MIWTVLQVGLGGALGAMGRYLSGVAAMRLFGTGFPMGTFSVNIIGSFLMGLAFVLLIEREAEASPWVPLVMTGILGGYTTFSAFSLDLWSLIDRGRMLAALGYLGGSVLLSFGALILGILLARGVAA
jgi:CrcB protein